jgi:hypothetical protein
MLHVCRPICMGYAHGPYYREPTRWPHKVLFRADTSMQDNKRGAKSGNTWPLPIVQRREDARAWEGTNGKTRERSTGTGELRYLY